MIGEHLEESGEIELPTREQRQPLVQGPMRHAQLGPFHTAWARQLYHRVGRTLYVAFEQWELGFLRDRHPEYEMLVWECIARACEDYLTEHPEADMHMTVGSLAGISSGEEMLWETHEMQDLRRRFNHFWNRMTADIPLTMREIAANLGEE